MMTGTVDRMVRRIGRTFTVRRATTVAGPNAWTAGTQTYVYMQCRGRALAFEPAPIGAAITAHEETITIDAASCAVLPVAGDWIAPGIFAADAGAKWRRITNVYAPEEAGSPRVYKLNVER